MNKCLLLILITFLSCKNDNSNLENLIGKDINSKEFQNYLNELKEKVENMKIQLTEEEIEHLNLDAKLKNKLSKNTKEIAIPKLNFVISSYYKGTGLEEVLKKLEKYLDTADVNESDITNI